MKITRKTLADLNACELSYNKFVNTFGGEFELYESITIDKMSLYIDILWLVQRIKTPLREIIIQNRITKLNENGLVISENSGADVYTYNENGDKTSYSYKGVLFDEYFYDDENRIIKHIERNCESIYTYNETSKISEYFRNGKLSEKVVDILDERGNKIRTDFCDGFYMI